MAYSASRFYLMDPDEHGFQANDQANFPENGCYLGIGCQKSVRLIEGPRKTGNMSIVLETKKTPFHNFEIVLNKVARLVNDPSNMFNGEIDRVSKMLMGILFKIFFKISMFFC